MTGEVRISIDAMGGDNGPRIVLQGARLSIAERPKSRFILHGRAAELEPILAEMPDLKSLSTVRDAEQVVPMDAKPSQALRKNRGNSSMWNALQAVKDGEADVAISCGNTGALMAMATFCLRPIEGISRPAIAAIWPTLKADTIVLDVGATVGGDGRQLVDFAVLGAAMARALFDMRSPSVGLLNVGVEEVKGLDAVKEAAQVLSAAKNAGFTYHGFVEGDDLGKGTVDVVVTEGFSGNIALKTAEGTARQVGGYLRAALSETWSSKLGALIASPALRAFRRKMDPRTVNGGVFLGLNGIVIKSHGSTDDFGFKSALGLAYEMASNRLIERIGEGIDRLGPLPGSQEEPAAAEATTA